MDATDRDIVEDLYRAFAAYERPVSFNGCSCGGCWGGLGDRIGFNAQGDVDVPAPGGDRPLQELTTKDLCNVVDTVPGTSGDLVVYKHYLPRILDLVATGDWDTWDQEHGSPDVDGVLWGLHEYPRPRWQEWPEAESSAVRRFVDRFEPDGDDDRLA